MGLINIFNSPITNHKEIINLKTYRRNLMGSFEVTHHKMVGKNVDKTIFKLNTTEKEILKTRSVISQIIIDIPLNDMFSKLNNKVIDLTIDTRENFIAESLQ